MTSFMYYCALGWFRGESVDVNVRSVVVSNGNVVKSSRTMYGGRNSALVGGLPCWV